MTGTWTRVGNIKGPQGDPGPAGVAVSPVIAERYDGTYPSRSSISGAAFFVGADTPSSYMQLNDVWFCSDPASVGVWIMTASGLIQTLGSGNNDNNNGDSAAVWTVSLPDAIATVVLGDGASVDPANGALLIVTPGVGGVTLDSSGREIDVPTDQVSAVWSLDSGLASVTVLLGSNTVVNANPAVLDVTPDSNAQVDVGGTSLSVATS